MVIAMTKNGDQGTQINSSVICAFFVYKTAHWGLQLFSHHWSGTSLTQCMQMLEQQQLFTLTFMWTEIFLLSTQVLTSMQHYIRCRDAYLGCSPDFMGRQSSADSSFKRSRNFYVWIQCGLDSESRQIFHRFQDNENLIKHMEASSTAQDFPLIFCPMILIQLLATCFQEQIRMRALSGISQSLLSREFFRSRDMNEWRHECMNPLSWEGN